MSGPKTIALEVNPSVSLIDVAAGMAHGAAFLIGAAADAVREAERLRQEAIRRQQEMERLKAASEAVAQAERRLMDLNSALRAARAAAPAAGVPAETALPVRPSEATGAVMQRHADHLALLAKDLQRGLAEARERAQGRETVSAALKQAAVAIARPPRTVSDLIADTAPVSVPDHRSARIRHILSRLEPAAGGVVPEDIERLAESIAAASETMLESLLAELGKQVTDHNRDRQQQRNDAAAAEAMLLQLGDLAAEVADGAAVAADLARVVAGARRLDDGLRHRHVAVLAAIEQAAKDRYASAMLRRSLADLGYEVGEEFATLFDGNEERFTQRPGWGDYHLAVRALPGDDMLNFRLVRSGKSAAVTAEQQRQDVEMEERWCADYPDLLARLEKAGLKVRRVRALAPGTVMVGTVPGGTVPSSRRTERPLEMSRK